MQLSSLSFFLFCLIVILVYRALPHVARKYWLLAASFYFYGTWSIQFLITIIVFTLTNYLVGILLAKADHKRLVLILGIGFNIFVLALLKYADFFLPSLLSLMSRTNAAPIPAVQILLPVGLSFMILQTIGYLVDIVRKQVTPERDFVYFAIYVMYFPKVLSGPIEHARDFLPQIKRDAPLTRREIGRGVFLFLEGLFRKRVIADLLWIMNPWGHIFSQNDTGKLTIILWLLAVVFALYMDFSGYTNMARGISYFLGIELSPNFSAPLLSPSTTEFWKRWHMSFTGWLREYIYFPLSRFLIRKTRSGRHLLNFLIPTAATMLFSALWHGLEVKHLIWAGSMGGIMIVEQAARAYLPTSENSKRWQWVQMPVMAVVLLPLIVPFFQTTGDSIWVLRKLMTNGWLGFDPNVLRILWLIVPAALIDWMHLRTDDEFWMVHLHWWLGGLILAAALIILCTVLLTDLFLPTFIYQIF